jgi:hypothetical protein
MILIFSYLEVSECFSSLAILPCCVFKVYLDSWRQHSSAAHVKWYCTMRSMDESKRDWLVCARPEPAAVRFWFLDFNNIGRLIFYPLHLTFIRSICSPIGLRILEPTAAHGKGWILPVNAAIVSVSMELCRRRCLHRDPSIYGFIHPFYRFFPFQFKIIWNWLSRAVMCICGLSFFSCRLSCLIVAMSASFLVNARERPTQGTLMPLILPQSHLPSHSHSPVLMPLMPLDSLLTPSNTCGKSNHHGPTI